MSGEVKVVFRCVVCGRAWSSLQSLRAHLKVHRREGYTRTSFVVKRDDWARFQKICQDHKTTACSLLGALITAAIKGEELGVINVGSENPAVIQVNQYFTGKPRGAGKFEVPQKITPVISGPERSGLSAQDERVCVWCYGPAEVFTTVFLSRDTFVRRWFCRAHAPARLTG